MASNTIVSDIKRQICNELHRAARRNFRRRRTIIKGYGDLWQIDLIDMQPYAETNNGYRYILIVIDCYSKYVWTRPLKNKTGSVVTNAMDGIIREAGYTPVNIQSDQGTEFYNEKFSKLMKKNNINHYSTYSSKKAAIVERAIRTLKSWLYKEFSARGVYDWLNILTEITHRYNNSKHRTINMKPAKVTTTTKLEAYDYLKILPVRVKFHIGDIVRISKYKGVFDKGYNANWSTELFKIVKINRTNPVTYALEDMEGRPIKGCFYEMELQKTRNPNVYLVEKILRHRKRRNGANEVFVKWMGFSKKHNSWILEDDIV